MTLQTMLLRLSKAILTPKLLMLLVRQSLNQYYEGEFLNSEGPLRGDAIINGALQFISGMSVDCKGLMEKAMENLQLAVDSLVNIMPVEYAQLTPVFWHPIYLALIATFEQGHRLALSPLRHRMAQIIDVCLMYLIMNRDFRAQFNPSWAILLPQLVIDNLHFREFGLLGPASQPQSRLDIRVRERIQQEEAAERATED
ncbi:hypothetical protein GQ53DRAFT_764835 [Thozetella sp. PMI_491]|nr:hypothetical protein GQ53DRAFT_764835 [Thozetella sp. PMI_491]